MTLAHQHKLIPCLCLPLTILFPSCCTSQPTLTIIAQLSRSRALSSIIGSVSLVWLMHYKSSPGPGLSSSRAYTFTPPCRRYMSCARWELQQKHSRRPQTAGSWGENIKTKKKKKREREKKKSAGSRGGRETRERSICHKSKYHQEESQERFWVSLWRDSHR